MEKNTEKNNYDSLLFRKNVVNMLEKILRADTPEVSFRVATNIEKGVFNYSIREADTQKVVKKWENPHFVTLYVDRLRSLYTNLSVHEDFRAQVLSGEIAPEQLSRMSHIDIAPQKWEILVEAKRKKDISRYQITEQASTSEFKCRRCQSRRCQYYELQVRSADESCSVYVNCLDCGKRWRVN